MWWECDNLFLISNQSGCARGLVHILPLLWRHREFSRVAGKRVAKAVLRVAPQDPLVRVVLDTMYSSVHQSNLIHVQGVPCPRRPGLGWLRFGGFPRLVGRYCSYLLPKQGGGTSQIQVNITQSTRTYFTIPGSAYNLNWFFVDIQSMEPITQLSLTTIAICMLAHARHILIRLPITIIHHFPTFSVSQVYFTAPDGWELWRERRDIAQAGLPEVKLVNDGQGTRPELINEITRTNISG